jgi:serine/threonine-protein kinase
MLVQETIINNKYKLVEEIGKGLSAIVWKAKKLDQEELYVLKIFNLLNPNRKQDFYNEWEVMKQFNCSQDSYVNFGIESFTTNIPMELGIIVSKYAKYGTLADLFENIRLGKETLSFSQKQDLILKILSGLRSIHRKTSFDGKALVHRDLKPANILLIEKTLPCITDFAISSWVESERVTENPVGAIEYMSPEALEGTLSQAIDVWAAGAVFYELLTEKPLYSRTVWTSPTVLMREICNLNKKAPLDLKDDIPLEIKNLISKALEKSVSLRYPSAIEMCLEAEKIYHSAQKFDNHNSINHNILPNSITNKINPSTNTVALNKPILSDLNKPSRNWFAFYIIIALFIPISLVFSYTYFFSYEEIKVSTTILPTAPKELLENLSPPGMVLIPKNKVLIGKDGASVDEQPLKEITVEAFYLDVTEVTNKDFLAFLKANPNNVLLKKWSKWKVKETEMNYPIVNITPEEAEAYASWLGKRLPTEEEWEYAARGSNIGTTKYFYPWGDSKKEINNFANSEESGKNRPVEVGQYLKGKSPFGILDLAGNVAEWTASCYKQSASNNQIETINPSNCAIEYRVFRGGSYHDSADYIQTTRRVWLAQSSRPYKEILPSIGFRCAKNLAITKEPSSSSTKEITKEITKEKS